jgi:hypothetical protein
MVLPGSNAGLNQHLSGHLSRRHIQKLPFGKNQLKPFSVCIHGLGAVSARFPASAVLTFHFP